MVLGFNVAAFDVVQNFLHQVLAMGNENEAGEDGKLNRIGGVAFEIIADERQAKEGEEARQDGLANDGEHGGKEKSEGDGQMIIVDQQGAERGGDAFAAAKT